MESIVETTKKFLFEKYNIKDVSIKIEKPKEFGDIAIPCFQFAKILKKNPVEIATELTSYLKEKSSDSLIEDIKQLNAYVNIYFKPEIINNILQNIKKRINHSNEKVMIEYSSPNANKPQHLGHLRNNLLGMSLSLLLERVGNRVIKASLVNDRGMGVTKTIFAYMKLSEKKEPDKKPDHFVGDLYVMANNYLKEHPEEETEVRKLLKKWEEKDEEVRKIWKKIIGWVLEGYKETYERLGVKFDKYYYESEIYEEAKPIIYDALKKGIFKKNEKGMIVAELEKYGLPDKVVLREDGTSVYVTNDIILAYKKSEENIDKSIYVVGNEHDLYFKQLFKILELLGLSFAKKSYHFSYGMVMLPEGKMKSREGTVVDADDIMDEMIGLAEKEIKERYTETEETNELRERARIIGLGALKFFILKIDPRKDMIFNPKESLSFEGETGPYIQYAATRIKSILEKAGEFERIYEFTEKEKEIGLKIGDYPNVILDAALHMKPSIIANYLIEISQMFMNYYHNVQILKEKNKKLRDARLTFIEKVREIIVDGLSLLTIEVPERM